MTDTPAQILLVEDDDEIREMVAELLENEGWRPVTLADGREIDSIIAAENPDLIVLDINLPGEDGLSICKRVSSETDISILMLTARSEDIDRIIGLEIGADDYLGKPFNPRELVARIRALLRRRSRTPVTIQKDVTIVADLHIDSAGRTISRNGEAIRLSSAEFDLFCTLAEAKGRILSRDFLLERIHGRTAHAFDRSIDVLVSRLRKRIDRPGERSLIEAVRNAGYVLRDQT